jgi:hypothetical protein
LKRDEKKKEKKKKNVNNTKRRQAKLHNELLPTRTFLSPTGTHFFF